MCGIAGVISSSVSNLHIERYCEHMVDSLEHRGPDANGVIRRDLGSSSICFGHSRLSILDLTQAGAQPMALSGSRQMLVFNGEIYNHLSIRKALADETQITWRGHSDTETLLHCLRFRGISDTLKSIRGMYAFSWLSDDEGKIYLARDAFGEKPLYYGDAEGVSFFCSELRAIYSIPGVSFSLNPEAISAYLSLHYVPAPLSVIKGIKKLPPASYVAYDLASGSWGEPVKYWSPLSSPELPDAIPDHHRLLDLVTASVEEQLVADVPVGCFLSGGYDSSLISAVAQKVSSQPVKTFSIGFSEMGFNEAPFAKAVAEHIGTEHRELYVRPEDALACVEEIPYIWDEPFADSSQIPTLLVSRFAKKYVDVCLSGDGGDELFAGYQRHKLFPAVSTYNDFAPSWLTSLLYESAGLTSKYIRANNIKRLQSFLSKSEFDSEVYIKFIAGFGADKLQRLTGRGLSFIENSFRSAVPRGKVGLIQFYDQASYLTDDILAKVDRAAMSCSLETRVPLLDRRLAEFSWSLDQSKLITKELGGKSILKSAVHELLPYDLMNRKKQGFSIPLDNWLRVDLKEWAHSSISYLCGFEELVDPCQVRSFWNAFLSGQSILAPRIWNLVMLGAWLKANLRCMSR